MKYQTLPDSRRISKRRDFLAIYEAGTRTYSNHFILFSFFIKGLPQRVGFAVSRKVGNAVARNRVKRLLREFFRSLPFSLPGVQLVVVAKQGAARLGLADVEKQLKPRLHKICRES